MRKHAERGAERILTGRPSIVNHLRRNPMRRIKFISMLLVGALITASTVVAQQNGKPLTNQDVISMVKSALPDSVILSAIKASDTDFDISSTGLIALKKAAVSAKVMEAMLETVGNKKNASSSPATAAAAAGGASNAAPGASAAPAVAAPAGQPSVLSLQGSTKVSLAAEPTQIIQTKAKPTSLSSLAADQALAEALNVGTQAAQMALMKSGSMMGNSVVSSGSSVLSNILSHRPKQTKVTYVWALSGGSSPANPGGNPPTFEVNYAGIPGVNADQFEPVIVKLADTPQANYRLVGATEAATTAEQSAQQDWPIYSSFTEDRIASKVQKLGSGHAQITPSTSLGAGEYAIALRPVDKSKKFSGEDVGKNQGEGLLFNYAWPFSVK
jgi:hypothetical protein